MGKYLYSDKNQPENYHLDFFQHIFRILYDSDQYSSALYGLGLTTLLETINVFPSPISTCTSIYRYIIHHVTEAERETGGASLAASRRFGCTITWSKILCNAPIGEVAYLCHSEREDNKQGEQKSARERVSI